MDRLAKADIIKCSSGGAVAKPDLVAVEEPLEIRIGFGPQHTREQKSISVTMRTPGNDFELALGFLFTEGIITDYGQVRSIQYCQDAGKQQENNVVRIELEETVAIDYRKIERHFYTSSSCGVCSKSSIEAVSVSCPVLSGNLKIQEEFVHQAPHILKEKQRIFEHTGGLHATGLFDATGELLFLREDVGRHNALDKVIGTAFIDNKIPLSNAFVLVSGRASFELVQKSLVAGIPMLAAVGAPSSLAVSLAQTFGMTLIGFVRDQGFNIYSGKDRIIFQHEDKD